MIRLHRLLLLLCLLALAMPLQGFAAATMAHGGASVESVATMAMDEDMAMDADACEHEDAGPTDHHADHKGSCSACAACYTVAAPGFSFATALAPPVIAFVLPPPAGRRVAFLTDGPERPPRTRLA